MKKILSVTSFLLCVVMLFSLFSCAADGDSAQSGSQSDTSAYTDRASESLDKSTDKPKPNSEEKKTDAPTSKPTEKETDPIPGKTKATKALTAKNYTFANMSKTDQSFFKFIGRVKPSSDGLIFDNSCATLEFQGFMTGEVSLNVTAKSGSYGFAYFTVYLDGVRLSERFYVKGNNQKITIANFSGNYFHTVKIVKQTEFKWALSTIQSLDFKGYLIEAPAEKEYYIEFLGDSLTTAYGNIGKPGDTPDDSPKFQDGTKSYAYLFAESVDADYSMISRSAAGLSQCWSNSPIIDYYKAFSKDRSSEAFDTKTARKPDLIVLHLGANDYNVGGSNKTNFVTRGKELINYFRSSYGTDIPIIWAYDPNEGFPDKVKEIMNSFGGESKGYYTLSLGWSERGAGGHPSANEHAKHATKLAELVKQKNLLK